MNRTMLIYMSRQTTQFQNFQRWAAFKIIFKLTSEVLLNSQLSNGTTISEITELIYFYKSTLPSLLTDQIKLMGLDLEAKN